MLQGWYMRGQVSSATCCTEAAVENVADASKLMLPCGVQYMRDGKGKQYRLTCTFICVLCNRPSQLSFVSGTSEALQALFSNAIGE